VAGTFTAHLHAAEYQRLKDAAKSQNAETIWSISRPVTGAATDRVKQHRSQLHLISKQRAGIKRALRADDQNTDASDEDIELPWAGTSLHGLMESAARQPAARLGALAPAASYTRAAAGYRETATHRPSAAPLGHEDNDRQAIETGRRPGPIAALAPDDGGSDDDLAAPLRTSGATTAASAATQDRRPAVPSSSGSSLPRVRHSGKAGNPGRAPALDEEELSDGLDSADFLRRAREKRAQEKARRSHH